MTANTKILTETIKARDYPRGLLNTFLSNNTKFVIYTGTYQQVVNSLDADGIPEHKVKGFAFVSSGLCEVIVHKH
jgi:hypothetical protein